MTFWIEWILSYEVANLNVKIPKWSIFSQSKLYIQIHYPYNSDRS